MRIFKNRGDIYFSKANKEKSAEQRILIIVLVVIVVFTAFFVSVLCITNDFSAKKFFAPDTTQLSAEIEINDAEDINLPSVSGKTNFVTMICDDDNLLFTALIQADMDNKAFKAAVLKYNTEIDGQTLDAIFKSSGAENVVTALEATLSISLDYYISIDNNDYEELFNSMGTVNYPVLNDIKYRQGGEQSNYTLKIKAGEQRLDGKHFINLIRYYLDVENNTSQANELILAALAQQLNSENMKSSEKLFRDFVKAAETNITIRDFSLAADKLAVITNDRTTMSVYNAQVKYDSNKISDEQIKGLKGYFTK